jgi:hypothetical protein
MMSGRGMFTWPDGAVYDGEWKIESVTAWDCSRLRMDFPTMECGFAPKKVEDLLSIPTRSTMVCSVTGVAKDVVMILFSEKPFTKVGSDSPCRWAGNHEDASYLGCPTHDRHRHD